MTMPDSVNSSLLECETTFIKIPTPWNFETRLEVDEFEVARMLEEHQLKMEMKVNDMLPQLRQEVLQNQQQFFQQHTQTFNEMFQKQQLHCQQLIQYFTQTLEENLKAGPLKDSPREKNAVELLEGPVCTTSIAENNKTKSIDKLLPYADVISNDPNSQQFQSQYETCCEDDMASVENVVLHVDSAINVQPNNNVEMVEERASVEKMNAPPLDVPKLDVADGGEGGVENVDQIFLNSLERYEQTSKKLTADKLILVNNKKKATKALKINVKSNLKMLDNIPNSSTTAKTQQPQPTTATTTMNTKTTLPPPPSNASKELFAIPSKRGKPRNAKSKMNKPDNDNADEVQDNDDDCDDDDYVPGKVPVFDKKLPRKQRSRKRSISENADIQKSETALPQIMETLSIDDLNVKQDKKKGGNVGRSKLATKTNK
ncbi:hypothetical protein HELRODRAFT_165705 [Helobdella robusta]|uniref:Uncharacterized protein n=1 Tax=Helobdella robusta TaxID=6412 RepID=T1EX71_HELRO|nr:hypothetical protein HELRODRAFT_165705 [Helobdella robusta]ESN91652.1 hypothetical protein HELRODRAFT_165705 [Helobdella robusta]